MNEVWNTDNLVVSDDEEALMYAVLKTDFLCAIFPELKRKSAVYSRGQIIRSKNNNYNNNDNNKIIVNTILFDTGALSANYVSREFVEQHTELKKRIGMEVHKVFLAAKDAWVNTTEVIDLNLEILEDIYQDNDMKKAHLYSGKFIILDMPPGNDMIIGLPAILGDLFTLFIQKLQSAKESGQETLCFADGQILEPPWGSNFVTMFAPEESLCPEPVNFGFALHYLEIGHDAAVKEYEELLQTHVSPDMISQTNVLHLLMTKGLQVFVPKEWTGIKGIPPLKLKWKKDLPERVKPKARAINPKIWEVAKQEMERLQGYFYRKSRSPVASPLVFAPKATKPFIRTCGDYVYLNKFIENGHYNIPNVQNELRNKLVKFRIFLDIDMTNSFHQIPLDDETSAKLSVQTPWGQFEPKFMPEGISPGSLVLQEIMNDIFRDYDEFMIVIFDNLLILAHDVFDAYNKLELFLDRCIQRNVICKMAKSYIGFDTVKFFGYQCYYNKYELTEDRKIALSNISFPEGPKRATQLRRLLGVGVFFKPFVANYSAVAAPLTDMTAKEFNWDETTWTRNYRKDFEVFKTALLNCVTLYFPDYSWEWTLRTDASETGIGAVLLQRNPTTGTDGDWLPIAFVSHKFSKQARHWTTIEQEAFAIFFAVFKLSYYLIGKIFTVETDHNNLIWMEASVVPKVIRWRVYLQQFNFTIRHISGKRNLVADWLSRLAEDECTEMVTGDGPEDLLVEEDIHLVHCLLLAHAHEFNNNMMVFNTNTDTPAIGTQNDQPNETISPREAFDKVHNSKVGHMGARRTWHRLNIQFPGHNISMRVISDWISECATCLKTRASLEYALVPIIRHLKPPNQRSVLGIDNLEVTPAGSKGQTHLLVCVNLFTKHVIIYPSTGCTALNLAHAIWHYWASFGSTDTIITDQGSDFTSTLFATLLAWIGTRHIFSITDRHANGVERTLKEVSRHLRAIVFDDRVKDVFDDPMIIPAVQYILNSEVHSETGYSPFELLYGSSDMKYFDFFRTAWDKDGSGAYVSKLNEHLSTIRAISFEYQQQLANERVSQSPKPQNTYQVGDLVLFDMGPKPVPKLHYRYRGPYEVLKHVKNDVTCRHIVMGFTEIFHVESLIIFPHNYQLAYEAALRDYNQYEIEKISQHKGDPGRRTTMSFLVTFKDGETKWVDWSKDLFDSVPYEQYVSSFPALYQLRFTEKQAAVWRKTMNKENITSINPGDIVYVDLQWLGYEWFISLNLPEILPKIYVLETYISHWYHNISHRKVSIQFRIFPKDNGYVIDSFTAYAYFSNKTFDSTKHVLVDKTLCQKYPPILR